MNINRREFATGVCALGATTLIPGRSHAKDVIKPGSDSDGFSFVHMTDMHVTPKRIGDKGFRRAIESLADIKPRPSFILTGGDLAFDGNYSPKPFFDECIGLYKDVLDSSGIPYYNCMGNHDVLGWSSRRKVAADDAELGKKMIMDRLEWENSYYSFDVGGWHFVVLDCIYPTNSAHGPTYEPRIGPEQLEWLAYDLGAAGDRPKVAVTHIAAFCNTGQLSGDRNRKAMDGNMVLWDTADLRPILERHKVKALLQGHSHQVEQYCFNNVWYLTSAAVSGAWWAGDWTGSPAGYTLFNCRGNELTWQHIPFHWEPHLEPEDTLERQKIKEYEAAKKEQARLLALERAGKRPSSAEKTLISD